ncbi:unnamed protein product [Protopolystoma xenopodis]|uniref:Uncharacterized protein n=1 Tax=Protopolystoma xenopodis TaxID=117903 RepID=A0A3S5CI87_9PLAT|nr:unnamed protein product [Protopolystoma xenopodis]
MWPVPSREPASGAAELSGQMRPVVTNVLLSCTRLLARPATSLETRERRLDGCHGSGDRDGVFWPRRQGTCGATGEVHRGGLEGFACPVGALVDNISECRWASCLSVALEKEEDT